MKNKVALIITIIMIIGLCSGCVFTINADLGSHTNTAILERDKVTIREVLFSISNELYILEDEDVENLRVSNVEAKVNDVGEIVIADLFDTSNEIGQKFVDSIELALGTDVIRLSSGMNKDCTLQIVEFDVESKNVVIQVISESAGVESYFDINGEYEGIYQK